MTPAVCVLLEIWPGTQATQPLVHLIGCLLLFLRSAVGCKGRISGHQARRCAQSFW